jgi:hypothetical protein
MNVQPEVQFSTIAELLFHDIPDLDFARLVSDLDTVLARFRDIERRLNWDYDDIATFDMPGTRIVLAISESPRNGAAMGLMLSVGPSHMIPQQNAVMTRSDQPVRHEALCARLVERVKARMNPDEVLWHTCAGLVGAEELDALANSPVAGSHRKDPEHPIFHSVEDADVDQIYTHGFQPANVQPDIPRPHDAELARLRLALYPPSVPAAPYLVSPQLRLAAYSMNATLMMVSLPIGAALMTYSVLRGDDMRMTSKAMVAVGVLSTLMKIPMAEQAIVLAGL